MRADTNGAPRATTGTSGNSASGSRGRTSSSIGELLGEVGTTCHLLWAGRGGLPDLPTVLQVGAAGSITPWSAMGLMTTISAVNI